MKNKMMDSTQVLAVGFMCIILLGAIMLHLPIASRDGQPIPLLDAIFTSTSATCVTGLVLYDTWVQFSLFGQVTILVLIQIGGLGFMTAVIAILTLTRRQIGLRQRTVLGESFGISQLSGIVRLSQRILLGTAFFEGIGAAILACRFIPKLGVAAGIWCGVFHSVSAFCNAGFDIMGQTAPNSSLTGYSDDCAVLLTVTFLVVVGGIGFVVWNDMIFPPLQTTFCSMTSGHTHSGEAEAALIVGIALVAEPSFFHAASFWQEKLKIGAYSSASLAFFRNKRKIK